MSRYDPDLLARAARWAESARSVIELGPRTPALAQPTDIVGTALAAASALCREHEGFIAHPYLDPVGVPTIGYGTTYYPDGRRVSLRDPPISRTVGEVMKAQHLREVCLPAVLRLCPTIETAGTMAAILDFTYNLGEQRLRASTMRRRILERRWSAVPAELRRWVFGKGRRLPGLVRRREDEIRLLDS